MNSGLRPDLVEYFWGARGRDLGGGEGFGGRISMEWEKKFHYPNRSVLYTPKKIHFFWLSHTYVVSVCGPESVCSIQGPVLGPDCGPVQGSV